MENHEIYTQAVKSVMAKSGAFSGGFDIMERLVKKQKKHQDIRKESGKEAAEIHKVQGLGYLKDSLNLIGQINKKIENIPHSESINIQGMLSSLRDYITKAGKNLQLVPLRQD